MLKHKLVNLFWGARTEVTYFIQLSKKITPYKLWNHSNKRCLILTMESMVSKKSLDWLYSTARKKTKFDRYKIISLCLIYKSTFYSQTGFLNVETVFKNWTLNLKVSKPQLNEKVIIHRYKSFYTMDVISDKCFFKK